LRRGLETAFAAPVEVHRRRMQLHQHSGRLHCRGIASDVVLGELAEAKLPRAAAFPEEADVEVVGELLCLGEELRAGRTLEGEEHVRRLDLGAASVRAFDLEGSRGLAENRAV